MTNYSLIPEMTLASITNYVERRVPPSSFLQAVLSNNLRESFACADENNRAAMFEIVSYCYWKIPADCWGSPEKVAAYLRDSKP